MFSWNFSFNLDYESNKKLRQDYKKAEHAILMRTFQSSIVDCVHNQCSLQYYYHIEGMIHHIVIDVYVVTDRHGFVNFEASLKRSIRSEINDSEVLSSIYS